MSTGCQSPGSLWTITKLHWRVEHCSRPTTLNYSFKQSVWCKSALHHSFSWFQWCEFCLWCQWSQLNLICVIMSFSMLINAQLISLYRAYCDMVTVDRCGVFRSLACEWSALHCSCWPSKRDIYVELLQHSETPTEHRQLSTASSVQLLLVSQSRCQLANDNSNDIVNALILARQHRSRMLMQGLGT